MCGCDCACVCVCVGLTRELVAVTRSESGVAPPVRSHDVRVTWGANQNAALYEEPITAQHQQPIRTQQYIRDQLGNSPGIVTLGANQTKA